MHLHDSWRLQSIIQNDFGPKASVSSAVSQHDTFIKHVGYVLGFFPVSDEYDRSRCLIAYWHGISLAEFWVWFTTTNLVSTKLKSRGCPPHESSLRLFWRMCKKQLQISDATEYEDLIRQYWEKTNVDDELGFVSAQQRNEVELNQLLSLVVWIFPSSKDMFLYELMSNSSYEKCSNGGSVFAITNSCESNPRATLRGNPNTRSYLFDSLSNSYFQSNPRATQPFNFHKLD
ncbi:hypothetical protein LIER_10247 [Lithospermum erythrorhizon]|uniref:Uncharacterized protein n=1 Tax=Lithospermum erythrorhizon TaxID=34254 RepID=A0AAV3PMU8_LITER